MSSKSPLLSICIPSFNRADFIGETLESICRDADPRIEVVVSDNASSDNTRDVVESFRARLPRLVYSRSDTNVGFAANFFRAVDLSSGEYAWLLGSDDVLSPGMLQRALDELRSRDTVYIYDRTETSRELAPTRIDPVLDGGLADREFAPGDRASLLRYLRHSRSIASLFSFISTVMFQRAAWDDVDVKPQWYDCEFPHAIRLWGMFGKGGTLRYVGASLVLARLDNDTFNPGDTRSVRRVMMNYHGFRMIRDEYWSGDPEVRDAVDRIMRRTHSARGMLKLRRIVAADEIEELSGYLRDFGYGALFTRLYRTDTCLRLILSLKRLFVLLRLSPDLVAG